MTNEEKEKSRKAILNQLDRTGLGKAPKEFAETPTRDCLEQGCKAAKHTTPTIRYTQETLASHMEKIFSEEIMKLRGQGQKEDAHDETSPFANFDRGAADLGLDRKQILWVYAMKHKDGISSFLQGHTSQREDVRGRICDLIVYLFLLRGMIDEEQGSYVI